MMLTGTNHRYVSARTAIDTFAGLGDQLLSRLAPGLIAGACVPEIGQVCRCNACCGSCNGQNNNCACFAHFHYNCLGSCVNNDPSCYGSCPV